MQFGPFDIRSVDSHVDQIRKFNIGKFYEYSKLYNIASHLYDDALHVFSLLHLEFIPHNMCITLALVA